MAEILGILASVQSTLTLIEQLTNGVKFVSAILRAPSEMLDLEEQIQRFHDIIQLIGSTVEPSAETVLHRALVRASTIFADLNHLFKTKLIGQGEISRRAQQKAWFKHRKKVTQLREKLKNALQMLLGAVTVESLSTARYNAWSLQETNEMLIRMHPCGAESYCAATKISPQKTQCLTEESNRLTEKSTGLFDVTLRSLQYRDQSRKSLATNQRKSVSLSSGRFVRPRRYEDETQGADRTFHQSISNAFESMQNYLPWTYTVDSRYSMLYSYDARELESTAYIRTKHCSLFYFKECRELIRLSVSITTTIESRYWDVERTTGNVHVKGFSGISSDHINSMVIKFLETSTDVKPFTHLSVYLGASSENSKCEIAKPPIQAKSRLCEVTRSLRHLQLRWLSARRMGTLPMNGVRMNFLACLDKFWVFGHRFASDQRRINADFYHFEFLHRLHETPGISPILGVVVDEEEIATAFLAELPSKGMMGYFLAEIDRFGEPVEVTRRVKWCKQVVEVVANAHNNRLVIGTLGTAPDPPFGIDGNDNVVLYRLVSKSFSVDHKPGLLPPECRQVTQQDGLVAASPETDIYQLGVLLWKIVSQKCSLTRSFLCRLAGCVSGKSCTASHADPLDLPVIDEDTPQYLRDVIAACRTADPRQRPPAHSLLNMFPTDPGAGDQNCRVLSPIQRVEEMQGRYGGLGTCDECGNIIGNVEYHCNTCASGDYDICATCFLIEGIHCLDEEHYLVERYKDERVQDGQNYYSNMKEDGKRKFLSMS